MIGLYILVVGGIYFLLAVFVTFWLASRPKKTIHQVIVYIFVASVFVLIPTADVIVGKIYFRYLCNTQSGQFVYKTVEVGDEYFLKSGELDKSKFGKDPSGYAIAEGGEFNIENIRAKFDMPFSAITTSQSDLFHITKWTYFIKRKNNSELLSESISFLYKGGWVENIYNMGAGRRCPDWGNGSLTSLMQATFRIKE